MMEYFTCRHCDREVGYRPDQAGTRIDCPLCGRPVEVPSVPPNPSPAERLPSGVLGTPEKMPDYSSRIAPLVPQTLWQRTWKFLLGLFLACGTTFLFILETRAVLDCSDSENWPTTIGTVESSRVQEHIVRAKGIPIRSYKPVVNYIYRVGPQGYRNFKLRFAEEFTLSYGTTEGSARITVDKYPPGSRVEVIYDPNDPTNTALERQVDGAAYPMLLTMIGCGFLGVRLILVSVAPFAFETNRRWGGIFTRRWHWFDWCFLGLFAMFGIWQIVLMPFVV